MDYDSDEFSFDECEYLEEDFSDESETSEIQSEISVSYDWFDLPVIVDMIINATEARYQHQLLFINKLFYNYTKRIMNNVPASYSRLIDSINAKEYIKVFAMLKMMNGTNMKITYGELIFDKACDNGDVFLVKAICQEGPYYSNISNRIRRALDKNHMELHSFLKTLL